MDKEMDQYFESLSDPLPEVPKMVDLPEAAPMQKTVLVDLAGAVEDKKTYVDEEKKWEKNKAEGTMAPALDVYEPGFRSDLYAAIKSYFKKQRDVRENNERLRKITGIGRTF